MRINSKIINIINRAEPNNRKKDFEKDEYILKKELSIVKAFSIIPQNYSMCKILFLGTIPSKRSKESGFYYFNGNNMFYEFVYNALSLKQPELTSDKKSKSCNKLKDSKKIILDDFEENKIAVYDIIDTCIRFSSSDNDIIAYKLRTKKHITNILRESHISTIFCTSKDSEKYLKECLGDLYYQKGSKNGGFIIINSKRINVVVLHSSSPISFHGKWTKEKVKLNWKNEIKKALHK